jgi:hypothetical protein
MSTRIRFTDAARALALAIVFVLVAPPARGDDDPLNEYATRFKAGLDAYTNGEWAEAIDQWDGIYRELGPIKAYRVAYDLGLAYEAQGKPTRAAENYESFLSEVRRRRSSGETIGDNVTREEAKAQEKLDGLKQRFGRIDVGAGSQAAEAQVDTLEPRLAGFVEYVKPGPHVVTFTIKVAGGEARDQRKEVTVAAGEETSVAPDPIAPPPAPPASTGPAPTAPAPRVAYETVRPFPAAVIFVTGGVAALSVVFPVLTYNHAADLRSRYNAQAATSDQQAILSEYPSARTEAYATLAIPITLGLATAGLAAWYFLGTTRRETTTGARPFVAPSTSGGVAGVDARF